mmetsp:Transcript_22756/g.65588  ORF Transcript_22756/g.65588 Transcript_22756/m.65588 type:complete len:147 (+) Transcript_22756:126-566(+)
MIGTIEQCIAGCWTQCGKKCVVDEDEIEIVGPLRQFSSGSGWIPGWLSRTGSALCTPRRPGDGCCAHPSQDGCTPAGGWRSRTGSALCTPRVHSDGFGYGPQLARPVAGEGGSGNIVGGALTGPAPTPRSGYNSRMASRHRTPRAA